MKIFKTLISINTTTPPGNTYRSYVDAISPFFKEMDYNLEEVILPDEVIKQIPAPLKGPRINLVAKKKFNHKNNLHFVQTDAHHLPFKNGSFDVIVALAFFPHLSEPKIALGEFRRILKSAGHIIIAHQMSRLELNEFHQKIKGPVTRDLLPEAKKMRFMLSSHLTIYA